MGVELDKDPGITSPIRGRIHSPLRGLEQPDHGVISYVSIS